MSFPVAGTPGCQEDQCGIIRIRHHCQFRSPGQRLARSTQAALAVPVHFNDWQPERNRSVPGLLRAEAMHAKTLSANSGINAATSAPRKSGFTGAQSAVHSNAKSTHAVSGPSGKEGIVINRVRRPTSSAFKSAATLASNAPS